MTLEHPTLSEAELQKIVLDLEMPLAESTAVLKKSIEDLPRQERLQRPKWPRITIGYDFLLAFAAGLILTCACALPWMLHKTARFEARVDHLSTQIDTLLRTLHQYDTPPPSQEVIQPLSLPSTFESAT